MQLARKLTAKQLPASNLILEVQSGVTVNGAYRCTRVSGSPLRPASSTRAARSTRDCSKPTPNKRRPAGSGPSDMHWQAPGRSPRQMLDPGPNTTAPASYNVALTAAKAAGAAY